MTSICQWYFAEVSFESPRAAKWLNSRNALSAIVDRIDIAHSGQSFRSSHCNSSSDSSCKFLVSSALAVSAEALSLVLAAAAVAAATSTAPCSTVVIHKSKEAREKSRDYISEFPHNCLRHESPSFSLNFTRAEMDAKPRTIVTKNKVWAKLRLRRYTSIQYQSSEHSLLRVSHQRWAIVN